MIRMHLKFDVLIRLPRVWNFEVLKSGSIAVVNELAKKLAVCCVRIVEALKYSKKTFKVFEMCEKVRYPNAKFFWSGCNVSRGRERFGNVL